MTDTYTQTMQLRPGRTEIGAHRRPWFPTIDLALWHHGEGALYVAQPLVMQQVDSGGSEIMPFARIGLEQAQQLIDELWRAGVRPTDGAGSVGQLGAVQSHLADMRAIAFGLLADDVTQPGTTR